MTKENGTHKAHVLVLPFPAQGHINPLLQFSKRLVFKGLKAALAIPIFVTKFMHADPDSAIEVCTYSDGYDDGGYFSAESPEAYQARLREVGSRTLASLLEKLEDLGCPIKAIVYDSACRWVLDVAKQFGVLGIVFFTQSCAVNSIYYHANKGLLKVPLSEPSFSFPGLPKLEPSELSSFLHHFGSYPFFYEHVVDQFSNVHEADWVLFNNFYELEKEAADWMAKLWKMRTVGPTVPSKYLDKRIEDDKNYGIHFYEPKAAACLSWLNNMPNGSVVYISFGSLAALSAEQAEEVAWGLRGSNYHFLWVVRASEEDKIPKNFLEETSERGLVVTWCPQLEVLAHRAVGCFLSHCGFNSVLESLSIGVPLVAMPLWTDQPTNAKYVEDVWGTGVRAQPADEKGIVRREVIERCIKEVMEGDRAKEIKKNATKWKQLAKQAADEGGSSDKNIDELVASIIDFSPSKSMS